MSDSPDTPVLDVETFDVRINYCERPLDIRTPWHAQVWVKVGDEMECGEFVSTTRSQLATEVAAKLQTRIRMLINSP